MRGQVLQTDAGGGLVLGDDGNRYRFATGEWKGSAPPIVGAHVDFIIDGNSAREVFPLAVAGTPPAQLAGERGNSELLGALGIACLVVGLVVPVFPLVLALILGLIGTSSAKTFNNRTGLVLSRIAWIGAAILLAVLLALLAFGLSFVLPMLQDMLGSLRNLIHSRGTTI